MWSICPRSFLFVIIQGINLVYSPQEPVAVTLDLPAKSLDTQSVGTKQQLGLSHSCQLNRGAGWILAGFTAYIWCIWSSVTSDCNRFFLCFFVTYSQEMQKSKYTETLVTKSAVFYSRSIQTHQTQLGDLKYTVLDTLHIQEQADDGL